MRRVLLDVDGVLADFTAKVIQTARDITGKTLIEGDFHDYDVFRTVGREHEDAVRKAWSSPGWCASLNPYDGASAFVARLRKTHRVYFVTAPMPGAPHWYWERHQWLDSNFGASYRDVIFTTAKHVVCGDFLVDDKPSNLEEWAVHNPSGTAVVFDQPYNRQVQSCVRAYGYDGLLSILHEVES
jgi:5'(3')-deoxyribonucleotidase